MAIIPQIKLFSWKNIVSKSDLDRLRRVGQREDAERLFERAFALERQAALATDTEPSRGILHRSAAWLALEAGIARDAEILAARGLSGASVPDDVAADLRAVLEDAQLRLHQPSLPAPGASASFEITMKGGDIGYGDANPDEVIKRIRIGQQLIHRTVERRANRPFRTRASVPKSISRHVDPRLRLAPGSFTLRFELGGRQLSLWDESVAVVEDLLTCFKALSSEEEHGLERRIPDTLYRQNFIALARRMAPDGKDITRVVITGITTTAIHNLVLKPLPAPTPTASAGDGERVEVVGELLAADATLKTSRIKLVPSDGARPLSIAVDDAILEDIVRPYFGHRVRAILFKKKKPRRTEYRLVDITEDAE